MNPTDSSKGDQEEVTPKTVFIRIPQDHSKIFHDETLLKKFVTDSSKCRVDLSKLPISVLIATSENSSTSPPDDDNSIIIPLEDALGTQPSTKLLTRHEINKNSEIRRKEVISKLKDKIESNKQRMEKGSPETLVSDSPNRIQMTQEIEDVSKSPKRQRVNTPKSYAAKSTKSSTPKSPKSPIHIKPKYRAVATVIASTGNDQPRNGINAPLPLHFTNGPVFPSFYGPRFSHYFPPPRDNQYGNFSPNESSNYQPLPYGHMRHMGYDTPYGFFTPYPPYMVYGNSYGFATRQSPPSHYYGPPRSTPPASSTYYGPPPQHNTLNMPDIQTTSSNSDPERIETPSTSRPTQPLISEADLPTGTNFPEFGPSMQSGTITQEHVNCNNLSGGFSVVAPTPTQYPRFENLQFFQAPTNIHSQIPTSNIPTTTLGGESLQFQPNSNANLSLHQDNSLTMTECALDGSKIPDHNYFQNNKSPQKTSTTYPTRRKRKRNAYGNPVIDDDDASSPNKTISNEEVDITCIQDIQNFLSKTPALEIEICTTSESPFPVCQQIEVGESSSLETTTLPPDTLNNKGTDASDSTILNSEGDINKNNSDNYSNFGEGIEPFAETVENIESYMRLPTVDPASLLLISPSSKESQKNASESSGAMEYLNSSSFSGTENFGESKSTELEFLFEEDQMSSLSITSELIEHSLSLLSRPGSRTNSLFSKLEEVEGKSPAEFPMEPSTVPKPTITSRFTKISRNSQFSAIQSSAAETFPITTDHKVVQPHRLKKWGNQANAKVTQRRLPLKLIKMPLGFTEIPLLQGQTGYLPEIDFDTSEVALGAMSWRVLPTVEKRKRRKEACKRDGNGTEAESKESQISKTIPKKFQTKEIPAQKKSNEAPVQKKSQIKEKSAPKTTKSKEKAVQKNSKMKEKPGQIKSRTQEQPAKRKSKIIEKPVQKKSKPKQKSDQKKSKMKNQVASLTKVCKVRLDVMTEDFLQSKSRNPAPKVQVKKHKVKESVFKIPFPPASTFSGHSTAPSDLYSYVKLNGRRKSNRKKASEKEPSSKSKNNVDDMKKSTEISISTEGKVPEFQENEDVLDIFPEEDDLLSWGGEQQLVQSTSGYVRYRKLN